MRYFVDTTKAEELGLSGTNLMVYSTLCLLAHDKPWKINYSQLARLSKCGDRMTAQRALTFLIDKELVTAQNEHIIAQNEHPTAQNVHPTAQNVQFSKEKKNQEKENIIIKESECVNNNIEEIHTPALQEKKKKYIAATPPTWEEWIAFADQKGIDRYTCIKAWSFYKMSEFENIKNWKAALMYWDLQNKDKPTPHRRRWD